MGSNPNIKKSLFPNILYEENFRDIEVRRLKKDCLVNQRAALSTLTSKLDSFEFKVVANESVTV